MTRLPIPFLFALGCAAAGDDPSSGQAVVIQNHESQPVYSYADAIRETVYVEAPIDSDHDGQHDRIALDIMRPKESNQGMRVAIVMEASPYYSPSPTAPPTGLQVPAAPHGFSMWYDEFFVPRGYAVVEVEMQGTARSKGCPTTGGPEDTASFVAAIDWLNGRAHGYSAVVGGTEVTATWSTGAVGMLGVSYNGTLPIAVASTGVAGLKTIVPIAAISSWYDYARDRGIAYDGWDERYPESLASFVVSSAQRATCADELKGLGDNAGDDTFDYTPFWDARNYRNHTGQFHGAVFVVHGQEDWNVKPRQYGKLWEQLVDRNVPRKIWLHREGHMDPVSLRPQEWKRAMHHWMDHWLYDVDNDVMEEPMATIQRPNGNWETYDSWPQTGTADTALYLAGAGGGFSGRLVLQPDSSAVVQTFTDAPSASESEKVGQPEQVTTDRVAFASEVLSSDVRISGTPRIKVTAAVDSTSAPLTALLVDYGTTINPIARNMSFSELYGQSCSLDDVENETGCAARPPDMDAITSARVVTRGSVDTKNRASFEHADPLVPNMPFQIEWPLHPKDYVFPAGHRIGVVITANLTSYIALDPKAHKVSITLAGSKLTLPVASGLNH